jgi:hypothetical protein
MTYAMITMQWYMLLLLFISVATIQVGPSTPFHVVVTFQQILFNCPMCATIATQWFLLLQLFTGYYRKYLPHYLVIVTTNLLC